MYKGLSGRNVLRYTVDFKIFGPVQSTEISNGSSATERRENISCLRKEEKDLIMRGRVRYIEKVKDVAQISKVRLTVGTCSGTGKDDYGFLVKLNTIWEESVILKFLVLVFKMACCTYFF